MFPNEDRVESKLTRGFRAGDHDDRAAKTWKGRQRANERERERGIGKGRKKEGTRKTNCVAKGSHSFPWVCVWNSPRRELKGNSARNTENVPAKRARCPRPIGH